MSVPRHVLLGCLLVAALVPTVQASAPPEVYVRVEPSSGATEDDWIRLHDTSDLGDHVVKECRWEYGDGTNGTIEPSATHGCSVERRYGPGTFAPRLTVVTEDNISATSNATVLQVLPAKPLPVAIAPYVRVTMPLIVAGILILLSLLVLVKGQPTIYNRVFFALYSTSAFKSVTDGLTQIWPEQRFITDLNHISGYFLITLFLWFVLVFPRPVWPWLKQGSRGAFALLFAAPFLLNHFFQLFDQVFFNVYVSIMGLIALSLLVYHAWETDSREERHRIQLLSYTFFLLVFTTILITGLQLLTNDAFSSGDRVQGWFYYKLVLDVGFVVAPILELVGASFLMYGIMRYQALGIEVFVKRFTRGALFALTIGVTFVTVGNTLEFFLEEKLFQGRVPAGFLVAGFAAAGAMYPVQKVTERVANHLFPQAGSTAPDYLAQRRMEIFEAQLRYALLDGHLKQKELFMLSTLRESLQIKPDEVRRVAALFPALNANLLLGAAPPMR